MNNYIVSVSPHIRHHATTSALMQDVLIALVPAFAAAILLFGMRAALITVVCVGTCVLSEALFENALKRPITIGDCSACVTGILLAYNLPVTIPLWQAIFGSMVAIVVVKQLFGGIGQNFANPAITARIVMLLAFPGTMSNWVLPDVVSMSLPDGVSAATPLYALSTGNFSTLPSLSDMFLGIRGGCLGETSNLALLLGGLYLLLRRVISWHTPVAFLGTVFVISALLGEAPFYQLLSGGLVLGAFFMATDYSSTPQTKRGKFIFGVGCGLITVLIRLYGSYPEGVSFSILLMNIVTPYLNMLVGHKPFGGVKT